MNIVLRSLNIICTAGVLLSTNVFPVTAADSAPVTEPIAVSQVGGLAAPKIVKARKGRAHIRLTWKKVKGASGYKVYRKTKSGKYKLVKTVKGGSNVSCLMDGFDSHTVYYFKLRAYKKNSGKTTFSKYSPAKKVTTKYGMGTSNYTDEAFSVKFDTSIWIIRGASYFLEDEGVQFRRMTPDGRILNVGGTISVEDVPERLKKKDLEYFVDQFTSELEDLHQPTYYDVEYGERFGMRCAFLKKTEDPDGVLMMALENGYLYYISEYYDYKGPDLEQYKKEIKQVLDSVEFTYDN